MAKILILSDQPVLLRGLVHVLQSQQFEIAGHCATQSAAVPLLAGMRPDLILLDITAGLNLASLGELHARIPGCPLVLWTDTLPLDYVFKTLEMGVRGIVQRTVPPDSLALALKKVAEGEMQIGFSPAQNTAQIKRQLSLTPRERELVGQLRQGLRNKQIAAAMNITEGTVKIYLFRLFHKLGVRTRFELARCAAVDQLDYATSGIAAVEQVKAQPEPLM